MTAPSSSSDSKNNPIKVMLVDDSAVIRGGLARILENDSMIEIVGSVSNGEMAVSTAQKQHPDIIILDIEMPVMDGLTALPKILEASPGSKVIMFSSLTEKGAAVTLKAFSLGAVECIVKPSSGQDTGEGSEFQKNMIRIIKNLITPEEAEGPEAISAAPGHQGKDLKSYDDSMAYKGKPELIAIGSSTGGPNALFSVLGHFSGLDIPVIITQHMPATFTKILAEHIHLHTGLPAHEGEEGMKVEKGHVYVAPGEHHMHLRKDEDGLKIHLDTGPPVNFCKPSVDPMFTTAIDIFGQKVLGVILTGMGHDGLGGAQALVNAGGRVIAQDEATSVVWGMPGAVAQAGLCSAILPLPEIGPWIKKAADA